MKEQSCRLFDGQNDDVIGYKNTKYTLILQENG
jgi:hypothetical protein